MYYSILAGNIIRFHLVFRDEDNALADPTTVTCEVGQSPVDVEPLDIEHDSTGKYHADWDTTGLEAGLYYALAIASGSLVATREIGVRLKGSHLV